MPDRWNLYHYVDEEGEPYTLARRVHTTRGVANLLVFTLFLPLTVTLMFILRPEALLQLPEIYRALWTDDTYLQWLLGDELIDEEEIP